MQDRDQTGIVFNVQRFSVHDGNGIRTVVFLKGCPLRCRWCSNPESQQFGPERAYNPNRCLGASVCGRCAAVCPSGGVSVTGDG
ncbi:MAG: 4Fe-4S cluster-binding domain-containing protein, partial [Desulfovibrionaceae bacterium]|nr:4Fe-4S cluster-binding domain-containing protein [Desulfovibrionaceae bacterium]